MSKYIIQGTWYSTKILAIEYIINNNKYYLCAYIFDEFIIFKIEIRLNHKFIYDDDTDHNNIFIKYFQYIDDLKNKKFYYNNDIYECDLQNLSFKSDENCVNEIILYKQDIENVFNIDLIK